MIGDKKNLPALLLPWEYCILFSFLYSSLYYTQLCILDSTLYSTWLAKNKLPLLLSVLVPSIVLMARNPPPPSLKRFPTRMSTCSLKLLS